MKTLSHLARYVARGSQLTMISARPFSYNNGFPKHKELFTDDYFEHAETENPYDTNPLEGEDIDKFDEPSHRMTQTGVLSNYKKQLNMTAQDYVERDYWDKMSNVK